MSTKEVTTKIAGIFKYPAGKELNKALEPGDEVHLVREPYNEYDKNAIAIYAEGLDGAVQLGYVQAPIALELADEELIKAVKGSEWDGVIITFAEAA